MSTVVSLIITVVAFGIIILIHELGHFLAAKASGIRINEFSLGMGPVLLKKCKGETQYSVRAFPIGGYVSMEGEDEASDDKRAFNNKPLWRRIIVVIAGACMNFILGILILFVIVSSQPQIATTRLAEVLPDSPAQAAGLQPGDTIVKVNGSQVLCSSDLHFQFSRHVREPMNLVVKRDGEKIQVNDLKYETVTQDGMEKARLGVNLAIENKTVGNVISNTFGNAAFYAKMVWTSLLDLVTGKVGINDLSGPVGVAQAVDQAAGMGVMSVLSLFAFITINVGVFNLIPFPALDGGRLVFLLIEAVRRKPIKKEIEGYVNTAGFMILILLMIFVTAKDIFNLF